MMLLFFWSVIQTFLIFFFLCDRINIKEQPFKFIININTVAEKKNHEKYIKEGKQSGRQESKVVLPQIFI